MKTQNSSAAGLRILVAHPSSDLYGSDRMLLESVESLTAAGAAVVVTLPADGPLARELELLGVPVVLNRTLVLRKELMRVRSLGRLSLETIRSFRNGAMLLLRLQPDMVYVNTITIPGWTLLGRLFGLPVVAHVHEAESAMPKWVRTLLYAPLNFAPRIVTNSRYSTDIMTASFPRLQARTDVVYNGVKGPALPTDCRPDLDGHLNIVYVGRLSQRKGVDVLIEGLSLLRQAGVPASLDLVGAAVPGQEAYGESLRMLVSARNLDDAVTFSGFVPDVWQALGRADVAVVPSRGDEPFGNTAVEALLAGRPLVVSNTSGLREAAHGYASALFVEPGNAADLARALGEVFGNWQAISGAAKDSAAAAERKHHPERYAESLVAVVAGSRTDTPEAKPGRPVRLRTPVARRLPVLSLLPPARGRSGRS